MTAKPENEPLARDEHQHVGRSATDLSRSPAISAQARESSGVTSPAAHTIRAVGRHQEPRKARNREAALTLLSIVAGLAIWEVIAHNTNPLVTSPLEGVWDSLLQQIRSGALLTDLATTMSGFALGTALATVIGIIIGLVMATNRLAFSLLDPWISALRSTPLITIAPLIIVAFGIGLRAKVVIVVLVAIFPVIINTADGVRAVDRDLIEAAASFGASRSAIFRTLLLPGALPFILSGVRLAITFGLVGEVVAEFFGSRAGLGYMVFEASQVFATGTVYLGIAILAAIGVILTKLMYWLERRIAPWRDFESPLVHTSARRN